VVKLSPSILSADFSKLGEAVQILDKSRADLVHIDIMDGHFVPNITIGPDVVKSLRNLTGKTFDVHLMIIDPDKYIPDFVKAGSDIITVHAETGYHLHRTVTFIKSHQVQAGIALNPATPLSAIDRELFEELDLLIVMTVNPGFGGQKFIESMLQKIRQAHDIIHEGGYKTQLEVDGGINRENAARVIEAGADILVAGNAVFGGNGDVEGNINALKDAK
jgi:ribulose-phosphate 3-epimerase